MAPSDHPYSSTRLSAARNARSRNNARSFASDSSRDPPSEDDVDDVDAEGAIVTKTGARCLLRRGDALLRSNVDAHGRVDHQTDVAYDNDVLEVHFFSRRKFLRTTETIAVVEDASGAFDGAASSSSS